MQSEKGELTRAETQNFNYLFEVPEAEREHFYKHMGHSKSVNIGTYQYPLPLLEMTKGGKHLKVIDYIH